ncbi:MAG: hypothetical protein HY738_21960 [Bacteroidia bacterium]|nr:hypothetical protein [Bacteroidia bacterium]
MTLTTYFYMNRRFSMSFISIVFIIFLLTVNLCPAQDKIGVGVYCSPALESLEEGTLVNNTYAHKSVINFGVNADFNINRRFCASIGLANYFKGAQMHFIDSSNYDTKKFSYSVIKANYISLPISAEFVFFAKNRSKFRKIKVYKGSKQEVKPVLVAVTGSIIGGYAYKQSIENRLIENNAEVNIGNIYSGTSRIITLLQTPTKYYIAWAIGLRATFNLNENLSFYIRPQYSKQINEYAKSDWADFKLMSIACDIGMVFTVR